MSEYGEEQQDQVPVEPVQEVPVEHKRPEDDLVLQEDTAPLSAEEVDLESQRKDESSSLAHDRYDSDGNRIT